MYAKGTVCKEFDIDNKKTVVPCGEEVMVHIKEDGRISSMLRYLHGIGAVFGCYVITVALVLLCMRSDGFPMEIPVSNMFAITCGFAIIALVVDVVRVLVRRTDYALIEIFGLVFGYIQAIDSLYSGREEYFALEVEPFFLYMYRLVERAGFFVIGFTVIVFLCQWYINRASKKVEKKVETLIEKMDKNGEE